MPKLAYIAGTCDTKAEELRYVRDLIEASGVPTCLVDLGIHSRDKDVDVTAAQVAEYADGGAALLDLNDRGKAVTLMSQAFARFMKSRTDVGGIIGLGGSGNTTIVSAGMQALPVGMPKIMVSTMAAGNVGPYVGSSDICMMYAVTDVAGLNSISRVVLGNAAHALAGMLKSKIPAAKVLPAVGMTMFGVTTPCVTQIRQELEKEFDLLVFHATGVGGRSMEKLADSGLLRGFIDITTTEVADFICGGVCSAGEDRLGAVIRTKLPWVGSVGAQDMCNFGAPETVPAKYQGRTFYRHNPHATLMRTTPDENRAIGKFIADKLNQCEGPVRMLLPEGGVSMIDAPGQPFNDPKADAALFETLEKNVKQNDRRRVIRLPYHINDPRFSAEAVKHFRDIAAG
ncbi:MAG TPA: Tm-1-like ATP-binding domain-containing protein [Planctomycetota bacterium]|nr:Tm-1-like ATP-binding domain-containing protein [Planctomycetota bacterium]